MMVLSQTDSMFESMEGSCKSFDGPLDEEQVVVPAELVWPEGQPTVLERLEQIQSAFASGAMTKDNVLDIRYLSKMDTKSENIPLTVLEMVDTVEGTVDAIEGKVGAVVDNVNAVKGEVRNAQMEIQEMKDMISRLFELIGDKLSKEYVGLLGYHNFFYRGKDC